jgi:hypothetical protein
VGGSSGVRGTDSPAVPGLPAASDRHTSHDLAMAPGQGRVTKTGPDRRSRPLTARWARSSKLRLRGEHLNESSAEAALHGAGLNPSLRPSQNNSSARERRCPPGPGSDLQFHADPPAVPLPLPSTNGGVQVGGGSDHPQDEEHKPVGNRVQSSDAKTYRSPWATRTTRRESRSLSCRRMPTCSHTGPPHKSHTTHVPVPPRAAPGCRAVRLRQPDGMPHDGGRPRSS